MKALSVRQTEGRRWPWAEIGRLLGLVGLLGLLGTTGYVIHLNGLMARTQLQMAKNMHALAQQQHGLALADQTTSETLRTLIDYLEQRLGPRRRLWEPDATAEVHL